MKRNLLFFAISLMLISSSCASFSYTNKKLSAQLNIKTKATFNIEKDRGDHKKALVILSLSGGGSRAAYWSSAIMLKLEDVFDDEGLNILEEVDVISSVSFGSLPAAYYAISKNPDEPPDKVPSNRNWDSDTVKDLMTRNYRARWFWRLFWPNNIIKYWFTAYDRSDIMAKTLADNIFDKKITGIDLRFKDLNPKRPYLILNSTNGTTGEFSKPFTFTDEDFKERLNSDINEYQIARAVMATASFPAVFNYMTLKDYRTGNKRYVHVFDGGNTDNLGLNSVKKVLYQNESKYDRIIVILVDAYVESQGVSSKKYDAREFFDYGVDLNFIDSSYCLLAVNRDRLITQFVEDLKEYKKKYNKRNVIFYHIQFNDINDDNLRKRMNSIGRDFSIKSSDIKSLDEAVERLIKKNNKCLQIVKDILLKDEVAEYHPYCTCKY